MTNSSGKLAQGLAERIEAKDVIAGVIGLGYVGLPLTLALVDRGFRVIGFDVDDHKIATLKEGKCYIKHLQEARVQAMTRSEKFEATSNFERIVEADILIICVPTPLTWHHQPDLRFVRMTTEQIAKKRGRFFNSSLPPTAIAIMRIMSQVGR